MTTKQDIVPGCILVANYHWFSAHQRAVKEFAEGDVIFVLTAQLVHNTREIRVTCFGASKTYNILVFQDDWDVVTCVKS